MNGLVPPYFDFLVEAFRRGRVGRCVHLGHWDDPTRARSDIAPAADEFERAQARMNQVLLGMARLRSGHAVLDAGCGFGGTLQVVNTALSAMQLTGVNVDQRQLDICREIAPVNGNRLHWEAADACRLPFADSSFDRVLCIEALFHFPSRRKFFSEAARVLKPGGMLVASDILIADSAQPFDKADFPIESWIRAGFGPWPDFWGKDADHRSLAAAAGLETMEMRDATANTRPSHRFTVPASADDGRDPLDPTVRAGVMLRWLHRSGHLRYPYMRFDKPA